MMETFISLDVKYPIIITVTKTNPKGKLAIGMVMVVSDSSNIYIKPITNSIINTSKNMKTIYQLLILIFLLTSASCGKNLAKRYSNQSNRLYKPANTDNNSFLNVELNNFVIHEAPAPLPVYNLLSLSPDGQAQLIKSINSKSASLQDMVNQVTTNFSFNKDAKQDIKIISKSIKKALVFTINRPYFTHFDNSSNPTFILNNQGDRLAYLELNVDIDNEKRANFNSWDKFVTDHVTLDLGKVTSAQQWNAQLNVNGKMGAEMSLSGNEVNDNIESEKYGNVATLMSENSADSGSREILNSRQRTGSNQNSAKAYSELGAGGSVAFSDKYETALDIKSRILKLSGTLKQKKLTLRQEGGQGFDLSGNVVVSVDYELNDDWALPVRFNKFRDLIVKGVPIPVSDLQNDYLTVIFPDIQEDITGFISYNFLYRQVNRGNRHLPEARHKVTYRYGAKKADALPNPLIKRTDIRPKAYQISASGENLKVNGYDVQFETAIEALNFYHYLGALLSNPENDVSSIKVKNEPITMASYKTLSILTKNL